MLRMKSHEKEYFSRDIQRCFLQHSVSWEQMHFGIKNPSYLDRGVSALTALSQTEPVVSTVGNNMPRTFNPSGWLTRLSSKA